jgi:TetR/AcrR family transcriptional regulator, copper-responsive repressor
MMNAPKRRGRPRAYDPERALTRVLESFWKSGYSGTSLDDIAEATGMNRPSLYAAFGGKEELYLKALAQYWTLSRVALREALADDVPLRVALTRVYDKALSIYFSGDERPRGCFAITSITEAVDNAEIRSALAKGLQALDKGIEARIRAAAARGELKPGADPAMLAMLASAAMHSIAIRARYGTARAELKKFARAAVDVICG